MSRSYTTGPSFVVTLAGLAALLGCSAPQALELPRISGFITAGGAMLTEDDAEYRGLDGDVDFKQGSVAGVQVSQTLSDRVSATVQLLAEGAEDFDVRAEWAYLSYQVTPALQLRAGRLGTPFYMVSDYYYVGYAQPFAAQPEELYAQTAGVTHYEGLDLIWRAKLGPGALKLQPLLGTSSASQDGLDIDLNNAFGVAVGYELERLSLRFGHYSVEVEGDAEAFMTRYGQGSLAAGAGFIEGLRAAGASEVADALLPDGESSTFTALGFTWQPGALMLQGEYGLRGSDFALFAETTAWYLMAGYRLGNWMPYVIYGSLESDARNLAATVPGSAELQAAVAAIEAAATQDQHSLGLGVRWDLNDTLALKAEWKRIEADNGTAGLFTRVPADGQTDRVVLNLSLAF